MKEIRSFNVVIDVIRPIDIACEQLGVSKSIAVSELLKYAITGEESGVVKILRKTVTDNKGVKYGS